MLGRLWQIGCLLLLLTIGSGTVAMADETPNVLTNGDFENALTGWSSTGTATVDMKEPIVGKGSLHLGPGLASVRQRYTIPELRILWFGVAVRAATKEVDAGIAVECRDASDHLIYTFRRPVVSAIVDTGDAPSLYIKTPPRTRTIVCSVENRGAVPITVDKAALYDYDRERKTFAPRVDLDAYMRPLWLEKTITDETVLLYSDGDKPASGSLLFPPEQVLAVRSDDLKTTYVEGKDYTLTGRTLTRLPDSTMPMLSEKDIPKTPLPWYNLSGKQVVVSYRHKSNWQGPIPAYEGSLLPKVSQRLRTRSPLTIVALGDSITLGMNVSGYREMPPYMPTWADLFAQQLRKHYKNEAIHLYNAGLGGQTSLWGAENADALVNTVRPDLVLIAFGMNDFWSLDSAAFRKNIAAIIQRVRSHTPKTEFILIASLPFDPAYTDDPTYCGNMRSYRDALQSLTGPGIRLLDMRTLAQYLYDNKKPRDLLTDPMHPNDFLARLYAQGLTAMLVPPSTTPTAKVSQAPRTFYLDPAGDDNNDGLAPNRAWKSLDKVSATVLTPGDRVLLREGATFMGRITITSGVGGTASHPIVLTSSGKRPATVVSPNSTAISVGVGGVEIRNLILKGTATRPEKGQHGISFYTDEATGKKLSHIRVDNVTITGFGDCGIAIGSGNSRRPGFEDICLTRVRTSGTFGPGIFSFDSGENPVPHGYAHRNLYLGDCDCSENHAGSGIIISGCDGALVERCRAANNRGPGGGVAIWAYAARKVIFRDCIASGTRSGGKDGGGFDLDGGCVDCVVENCLAYENEGPGFMHCDYPTAFGTRGNIIRNSISINDGRKQSGDAIGFGFVTWGSGLDDCHIENNLAVVNTMTTNKQDLPLLFVTYLPGSQAKEDVLHVRGCTFKNNSVMTLVAGPAFVLNDLPAPTTADVLFEGNSFYAANGATPAFLDGPRGKTRFTDVDHWQKATGQETRQGRSTARIGKPIVTLPPYRLTDPHQLRDFPLMKALRKPL